MSTAHLPLPGRGDAWCRAIVVTVLAVVVVAACSRPPVSSLGPSATSGVDAGATELPLASPDVAVRWEPAGTSAFEMNDYFHAVALQDGRVLVVGSREADPRAELWDPSTNEWVRTEALNKPRYAFAAVGLRDGRVLVAGGLNEGTGWGDGNNESFSSAYLFDPAPGQEAWAKVDLMGVARTAPSAALLPDGRVLVVGGYYYQGANGSPSPSPGTSHRPSFGFAWDTAELFDPVAGTWSATGSMHHERAGAAAATLTDGRVLVVGSGGFAVTRLEDEAFVSAEIYDPRTGRFSRTGGLPPVDREALVTRGIQLPDGDGKPWSLGTLVALPDGGALLVGNTRVWDDRAELTRVLRFDAWTGTWTDAADPWASFLDGTSGQWLATPGNRRHAALAARLADGRVLVAGGESAGTVARTAELFDPATGTWLTLPDMPSERADGDAVRLDDGSVMLVGGYASDGFVRAAIRMVP